MKIIGLITTKNRLDSFKCALESISNQTRKPDQLIVVSDSLPESKLKEKELAINCGATFIENFFTNNYAGSLNSAIHYIIRKNIFTNYSLDEIYIAMLDDDDIWMCDYLEECEKILKDEDFVVSGLIYCNEKGIKKLSIPDNLTIDSFLKGNPHIQGSNTFVKLTTLLKAGLFDENMNSSIDRDIFVRIMLLKPTYAICNRYLVKVNAYNFKERITNNKQKKMDGLQKFYYKYNGYMSEQIKQEFFYRNMNLFKISKEEIENIPSYNVDVLRYFSAKNYDGNLVIGFIATEYKLGLRLLQQLVVLRRKNTKILVFINFIEDKNPYFDLLQNSGYIFKIIDKQSVISDIKKEKFDPFISIDKLNGNIIKDIAVTRTILQKYLYEFTDKDDVIWILDEDMELKEIVGSKGKLISIPINIDQIIGTYKNKYDAVVGNYTLDPPLPMLSTLRTTLLDYVYNKTAKVNNINILFDYTDYFYDLSDYSNVHLETPIKMETTCTLNDVFSGKAQSRPLFICSPNIKEFTNRGGNTLVFNRELLKIPNWSIFVDDKIGRRGDYFWIWQVKEKHYKIANAPFGTVHNRSFCFFNIAKEEEKLLLDLIGYSFTKSISDIGITARKQELFNVYCKNFINRLAKYIASFYRINGLLSIIDENKYCNLFTMDHLKKFLHRTKKYVQQDVVMIAFDLLQHKLQKLSLMNNRSTIQSKIENKFSLSPNSLKLLGCGLESLVFTNEIHVYKYFFKNPENIDFLKKISKCFYLCKQLYSLEFFEMDGATVILYPYEKSVPYESGHVREFAELLYFAKNNGFVFNNYKKDNFIVANGKLKLIDYGNSFSPYSKDLYKKSIKRVFQILNYPFLNENEFKLLIKKSYQNDTLYIDDRHKLLENVINHRHKEELHDDIIIDLINEYCPQNILDYGAGKCKIANKLSSSYNTDVFDIDFDTLKKYASPKVNVFDDCNKILSEYYDVVISNLVLCCINNNTVKEVIKNIANKVKINGHVLISICNPFFNNIQNTELRTNGIYGEYNYSKIFLKHATIGNPIRKEYHRPFEYYINLFERNGLKLEYIVEGQGVDVDTLHPIAEHLVFVCKKRFVPLIYENCSLMIKVSPKESKSIYQNISHIVLNLEKEGKFEKRIAIADLTKIANWAYDVNNEIFLKKELERAKANGLLDEIIYANDDVKKQQEIFDKYFGTKVNCSHSADGQGIYSTLLGFESIPTKYVFQTDSDILYCNKDRNAFIEGLELIKQGAITVSIGIASTINGDKSYGNRTEVRSCFLNLQKLQKILPLPNFTLNGVLQNSWHRSLDKVLLPKESIRLKNKNVWFIHPENPKKLEENFVSYVENHISLGNVISDQYGKVNLQANKQVWAELTNESIIVYIYGFNTSCEKLKRLFDSLKRQTFQNFKIIYIDDGSTNESAEYAKAILKYDKYFNKKSISFFNDKNVGALKNFVFVMQNVVKNKNAIVINLYNDGYLVNNRAIEIIIDKFSKGAEITCGNCINFSKPLKKYKIESFEKIWERDGDNIWLHPKCFKRYLFDYIDIEKDLKINGKFVEVNTDFAFILPMIRNAKKKVFIEEILYYFQPNLQNIKKRNKYKANFKDSIKEKLLQKEKEIFLKKVT